MPMTYVTTSAMAPTAVISKPLLHHERIVISDLAAPTTKWAIKKMMAAVIIAGIPAAKKNGMIGMNAPTAVDTAPETAETQGLRRPSSVAFRRSRANACTKCSLLFAK